METKEEVQQHCSGEYVGQRFGHEAVQHVLQRAEDYCACEQRRIDVANQPKINALKAGMELLIEREGEVKERIRRAPPLGDLRNRQRKGRYYWAVTLFLGVAGFFFSLLAFDPYRLGWKSYLYCVGIAVVAPSCVDKFLESWGDQKLIRALSAVACAAALTSLVQLAVIRGDVLIQYVKTASPAVVFTGERSVASEPQNDFFDTTLPRLKWLMALLSLAMELGAGLALYDARRLGLESTEDPSEIRRELAALQQDMVAHVHEISALQNEAAQFATRFWRDFHRAMLSGAAGSTLKKSLIVALCAFLLSSGAAFAGERLNIVIAVDLSKSVAVNDKNQLAEFQKNLNGVGRLLTGLPPGSRLTVIGITDDSFAQPDILLSADIGEDVGYFKEKLAAARRQIIDAWTAGSARLLPQYAHTDILGCLLVASELFKQTPEAKRVLVIFSDMRQETPSLALESLASLREDRLLASVEKRRLFADLQNVEVYALGVDSAGKSVADWTSLRDFWTAYFRRVGAVLKAYSVLREPPDSASLQ